MNTVTKDIFGVCIDRISQEFSGSTVVIPHVCNNIGSFGGGFTGAIKSKYPIVGQNFQLLGKNSKLGYVQYVSVEKRNPYGHEMIFANMIAQNGVIGPKNKRPINYEALVKCMIDVRAYIKKSDKEKIEIHCPKFGSGLAGGKWEFIEDLIHDIWFDIDIFVYNPIRR